MTEETEKESSEQQAAEEAPVNVSNGANETDESNPEVESDTESGSSVDMDEEEAAAEDEGEEEEGEGCPDCKKGAPAWMATFADMATLLMAFFVLILSFAQVNVPKYKEVAGSMRSAFGVQTVIPSIEPPTAESIILQQYQRTETEATPLTQIEEQKTDEEQDEEELSFDIGDGSSETNALDMLTQELRQEISQGMVEINQTEAGISVSFPERQGSSDGGQKITGDMIDALARVAVVQANTDEAISLTGGALQRGNSPDWYNSEAYREDSLATDRYELIRSNLSEEIADGLAQVTLDGDDVIVTLTEQGSFQSGSAELETGFFDVLNSVGSAVTGAGGLVEIEGHTDNVPLAFGGRYRDNWDLSSARSSRVADYMLQQGFLVPGSVVVEGYADTKPVASNDSVEGRAANRRIEVIIRGS
ncbi:MAG: flagellar motor protein MotB [Gammaproteobacteria bacterium]|nr:flagellar motor protein MotB [Gammaproteobacteria bacterium]